MLTALVWLVCVPCPASKVVMYLIRLTGWMLKSLYMVPLFFRHTHDLSCSLFRLVSLVHHPRTMSVIWYCFLLGISTYSFLLCTHMRRTCRTAHCHLPSTCLSSQTIHLRLLKPVFDLYTVLTVSPCQNRLWSCLSICVGVCYLFGVFLLLVPFCLA